MIHPDGWLEKFERVAFRVFQQRRSWAQRHFGLASKRGHFETDPQAPRNLYPPTSPKKPLAKHAVAGQNPRHAQLRWRKPSQIQLVPVDFVVLVQ